MVQDRLTTGGVFFIDAFMADLDVRFAQLFFAAYDATGAVPRAWAPLFEARARPGLLPIQSALAGANAHIEHGLPLVMVTPAPRTGARRPAPGCAWTTTRSTNSSPMSKPRAAGPS
jgi:hypothetical protein